MNNQIPTTLHDRDGPHPYVGEDIKLALEVEAVKAAEVAAGA